MSTLYKRYTTKHILNVHRYCDGGWFWNKYSAFPYAGCEWGCAYCYSRDEKYHPHKANKDPEISQFNDSFSQYIKIKEHAPELLRKALQKKPKDLIYLDSYQPVENHYYYVRGMLEVCAELGFPVFVNEKSAMVLADLDILIKINQQTYVNVGWSIITATDDTVRSIFEPRAPRVAVRFAAMKKLAEAGIVTGTIFMPVLPFIYDTESSIEAVIKKTKESGGQYVLEGGLTLWGFCGTYFYTVLQQYKPDLVAKYKKLYSSAGQVASYVAHIHSLVLKYCQKYALYSFIPRPIEFYSQTLQRNKKIAEKFYHYARELQLSNKNSYQAWAYRKAAWSLDDLKEDIGSIFQQRGIAGIVELKGIGNSIAHEIVDYLNTY